jgi:hypothetical protein
MATLFIEHAHWDTPIEMVSDAVKSVFNDQLHHIDVGVTEDYKAAWRSFTIYLKHGIDCKFLLSLKAHPITDQYVLYYSPTEYWVLHII